MRDVLVGLLIASCGLSEQGTGGPDGAVDVNPPDAATDMGMPIDASSDAIADVRTEEVDTCDKNQCPGKRCELGACAYYGSCAQMHKNDPALPTGIYKLESTAKPGSYFDAFCDQSTSGGGWTLVARSVTGFGYPNFGWKKPINSPNQDTLPYVLDMAVGFSYSEILFGTYSTSKTWALAHKATLPAGFPVGFENKGAALTGVTTVSGCDAGAPAELANVGYTDTANHFFFDATASNSSTGLYSDEWKFSDSTCTGKQQAGMIMVR